MEMQLRFNWQGLVEEAKQRRKTQKITQQKLAMLAGVSVPTILRFEKAEENIEISSVLKILQVLGLRDSRNLDFTNIKAKYDPRKMSVIFLGQDSKKSITCEISAEALEDHFNNNYDYLKTFIKNHSRIEHEARKKYLNNQLEKDGSILIRSEDL